MDWIFRSDGPLNILRATLERRSGLILHIGVRSPSRKGSEEAQQSLMGLIGSSVLALQNVCPLGGLDAHADCMLPIRNGAEPGQDCHTKSGSGSVDQLLARCPNPHLRLSSMMSLGRMTSPLSHLSSASSVYQWWTILISKRANGNCSPDQTRTTFGP